VIGVPAIPLLGTGKVDHVKLKEDALALEPASAAGN
jgi:hypothetical protein